MRRQVASTVRSSAFRKRVLSFAKTCSIGLRSGEWRQEEEFGAGAAYRLAHGLPFVAAQIVHDDDVARREGWNEELFDIGQEASPIDGAVDDAGRLDPVTSERCKERECSPVPMWNLGDEPL